MIEAIDIGSGQGSPIDQFIKEYFPDWGKVNVTTLDANPAVGADIIQDITEPIPKELVGQYDFVFMSHVLEHIEWINSMSVFKNVASLTKPGGYFLLIVPSVEWVAKEIVRGKFGLGVITTLYGSQNDTWMYHKSGYTRPALEIMTDRIGFKIYSIRETESMIVLGGFEEEKINGNYLSMQWEMLMKNVGDNTT